MSINLSDFIPYNLIKSIRIPTLDEIRNLSTDERAIVQDYWLFDPNLRESPLYVNSKGDIISWHSENAGPVAVRPVITVDKSFIAVPTGNSARFYSNYWKNLGQNNFLCKSAVIFSPFNTRKDVDVAVYANSDVESNLNKWFKELKNKICPFITEKFFLSETSIVRQHKSKEALTQYLANNKTRETAEKILVLNAFTGQIIEITQ